MSNHSNFRGPRWDRAWFRLGVGIETGVAVEFDTDADTVNEIYGGTDP
jgi:hypothetical protein